MKKICYSIGSVMILLALIFIAYAFSHPEATFSFPVEFVIVFYCVYIIAAIALFTIPTILKRNKK